MFTRGLLSCALAALSLLSLAALAREPGAVPVAVISAAEADIIEVVQLTGTVTARRDAQLSVSAAGLVTALHVDAGDQVEQGELLLEMDAELARLQYASASAAVTQAQHALADARRRLEEARSLAPQRSIAETVVRDLAAEVAEDEAALEQARAEAGHAKGLLERHQLFAPFAGVISSRSVELGEWLTPGQAVLGLVSTQQLRLDFQVPEDYLGRVATGTTVQFTLGADRSTLYPGTIVTTVPVTDPSVRTFLVRIEPTAPVPGILPGMSARADLELDTGRRGVTIPRDAILRYADGRIVVWVVEANKGAHSAGERQVQTGLYFDGRVEIRRGLSAGERVVTEGNEALRNGQLIDIRPAAGA